MTENERLKIALKRLNIKQTHLADNYGMDRGQMSKVVNGKGGLQIDMLQFIHNKYSINLNWLLCGSGNIKVDDKEITLNEPITEYGNGLKDKYIEVLEENRQLNKQLANYQEFSKCDYPKKESSVANSA